MLDGALETLVTFNPISTSTRTTLDELAQQLDEGGFHHWPVVNDERHLVGIISDSDIVRHLTARQTATESKRENGQSEKPVEPTIVAQFMSKRVISIEITATRAEALTKLIEYDIHSLPVLEEGRLVGIVTSTDVLRELSQGDLPGHRTPVSRCMIKTDESVEADADLDMAKITVLTTGMAFLPVTRGDFPLGVVSRRMLRKAKCRLIVRQALHGETQAASDRVGKIITDAPAVKPGDRLATAAQIMVEHSAQGLAVVNQGHRLLGVVSEHDVLRAILKAGEDDTTRGKVKAFALR